jgi:hypothetical protein
VPETKVAKRWCNEAMRREVLAGDAECLPRDWKSPLPGLSIFRLDHADALQVFSPLPRQNAGHPSGPPEIDSPWALRFTVSSAHQPEFHLNSFTPPLSQVLFYLAFTLRVASRRPVPLHSFERTPPNSSCARQYPRSCPTWASMGYGRSVPFLSCDAPKLTIPSFSRISFSPPLPPPPLSTLWHLPTVSVVLHHMLHTRSESMSGKVFASA